MNTEKSINEVEGNAVLPLVSKRIYHYRISSLHNSRDKYGKCEQTEKHASEVFCQSEQLEFFSPISNDISLTYANCKPHVFGHEECLLGLRR